MFGVKMESAAICRGCLSTDRKLSSLTSNKTYFSLLTDTQKQEGLTESELLVCWECTAALNRMQLFQAQTLKAYMVLEQSLDNTASLKSLSTLTTSHKYCYDAIFHEIEDKEIPIKKEKLSVESGGETKEEDCNDVDNSDQLEVSAELNFEEVTMPDVNPLSILKNKQQIEKIENDTINTKIKIMRLKESETKRKTGHTIMKRPPSSRIKKIVGKKIVAEERLKKKKMQTVKIKVIHRDLGTSQKKTLKRVAPPVQFRQGIRKSKRLSGIDVEETKKSNEYYVETNNTVGLIKDDKARDSDIGGNNDIDPSIVNENGVDKEEVKDNKTENVSDGRSNVHMDGTGDEGLEASDEVSNQAEENEEYYKLIPKHFRKTIVEYRHVELDTYFTKLELSEDETKAALEREPRYVTKELPHDCGHCGLCFKLRRTADEHERHSHMQLRRDINHVGLHVYHRDSVYRCKHCPVVLRRHKTAAHMKYAHRIRYRCRHCDMEFWKKAECRQHMITNHSRFDCDLCAETRPSWKLLERHKIYKHKVRKPRSTKNFVQCEECGKELYASSLIAHQEMRHPREGSDPRLRCAPCARTLRSDAHYQWHMKYSKAHSSPAKAQRVVCVFCGKECNREYIEGHYVRFHNQKSDFQCEICGKYFSNRFKLLQHVNCVHLKVRRPKNKLCTICGRGFSNNRVLGQHIRTHTGERPFACALCPAAFAQPYSLRKHTAARHATRKTTERTSRDEVSVESRSQHLQITEGPAQDEVIIESQKQDG